jgi:hypothetical protein
LSTGIHGLLALSNLVAQRRGSLAALLHPGLQIGKPLRLDLRILRGRGEALLGGLQFLLGKCGLGLSLLAGLGELRVLLLGR